MHDGLKKWDQALKPDPILSILYFKILFFLFIGSSLVAGMIRIGNLMNSEIYGTPTNLPWGFVFLRGREQFCGSVTDFVECPAPTMC